MKKLVLVFLLVCLLALSGCAPQVSRNTTASTPVPSTTQPAQSTTVTTTQPALRYDLSYDMNDYSRFSLIFAEKSPQWWEEMGSYTLLLNGFKTPVIVEMDGMTVVSVSAYGQTKNVNLSPYRGDINAEIQESGQAILINDCEDYSGNTWIITPDQCFEFHPQGDISTQVYISDDGRLRYRRYWGEYDTSFAQWDTAPLDLCTSRDQFLYEIGTARITQSEVALTADVTVTVSDLYDLDAMFAIAKAEGMYPEYNFVDELLAANKQAAS